MRTRILIVDDKPESVSAFARILEQEEGYEVVIAEDDPTAWYLLDEFRPDLIILDICLGCNERGGFDLLKRIKAKDERIPVIVLTELLGEELELRSLDLKAVSFVRKSSSTPVLQAHVRRWLPQGPIVIDDLKIGLRAHRVWVKREDKWYEIHLEPIEYEVLKKLVSNPGRVIPRDVLENLFPDAQDPAGTLNRYISELRTQLEPDPRNPQYILTKRSVGYWFKDYR